MALDPIPALPDQERRTRYTISPASADPVQVGFDIYGSGTDPTAWIEVYVDGEPFTNWTLSSPSGPLNIIARPITDAIITPGEAWSGTIDIVAAERPFRTVQLQDGRPVDPRTFNFAITQLTARQREAHDRFERTVKMPFGDDGYTLPFAANRANTVIGFDGNGTPALYTPQQDITQAVRFDIAQSLTDEQKERARENIGIVEYTIDAIGADITNRLNEIASVAETDILIRLPAGEFILSGQVSFANKNVSIFGSGSATTTLLCQSTTAGISFSDSSTNIGDMKCLSVSGLAISKDIDTAISAGGTAISGEWSCTSATGSTKTARFVDVTINSTATGRWWNKGIRLVDGGGVVWDGVRIYNQDSITDSEAVSAIEIVRDGSASLTQFFVANCYLRAFGAAIKVAHASASAGQGTVEGIYVVNTEMVTTRNFLLDDNSAAGTSGYVLNGVHFVGCHGNASRCAFDTGHATNVYIIGGNFSFQANGDTSPAPLVAAGRCTVIASVWTVAGNRFWRNSSVTDPAPAFIFPTAANSSRIRLSGNSIENWSAAVNQAGTPTNDPAKIYVAPDNQLISTPLSTTSSGYLLVNPSAAGTIAVSATSPLSLNPTTGDISITGSALTTSDDTNVTLTLGGAPTASVLAATSITAGWTGTLAVSRGGSGASTARGAAANYQVPHYIAQSAVQVTHTGDTVETVLATIPIPANAMGPNGRIVVTYLTSNNNSGNNKTYRVRFGGPSGTSYRSIVLTTQQSLRDQCEIANRNSASSQVGFATGTGGGWGGGTNAPITSTEDTTASVDVVITGTLANGTDNLALEYYRVEVYYGA